MIFTEKKITINNNQCKIDSPVVLYRGDYNVEVRFTIVSSPYKYGNRQETNLIESTEASYGQLIIQTPNTTPIFSEVTATKKGAITFTITAEMIDEVTEIGSYTFQIRLLDENKESRVTIPEVVDGIEIREPIATEDTADTNEVNVAAVGYAMTTAGTTEDAFDSQGNYNKTTWGTGDRITAEKLNKIEQGITGVNNKVPHYNETLMFEISNGDYSSFVSGSYFNMSALNLDETKLYVGKEINSGEKYNYKFIYDKETDTLISEDNFLYIYNHKSYDGTNFIEDVNSAVLTIDITPMDLSELEGEGYFRLYEVEKLELDNNCLSDNVSIVNSLTVGTRMGDIGKYSVAEGCFTVANAYISHAEGSGTTASGLYSHAESSCTTASGEGSHAEGNGTTASGNYSHTEGISTTASGNYSHAEGRATTTSGIASHAEGNYTIAKSDYQHVQGKYNIEDTTGTYAHIVGNGTSDTARSNAHTLDWQGNAWYQGKISQDGVPTEDKDLTTKKYVDDALKNNTPTGGSNINDTTASATTTYSSNKIESIIGSGTLNTSAQDIKGAINEVFQNASNGKTLIAQAITGKGIDATSNDTWQELATKISQILGSTVQINSLSKLSNCKFNLISSTSNTNYNSIAEAGKNYNDASWDNISIPHDWSIYNSFNSSSPSGYEGGYLDGGDAWYRFKLKTAKLEGQKIYVYFDGIYMESDVYINGTKVKSNKWYNPFYVDITDYLEYDNNDTLAVFVRNQQPSSRWYSGSGIIRNAYLVSANDIEIGINDINITTPTLEDDVKTNVANTKIDIKINSTTAKTVNLVNEIYFNNSLVKTSTKEVSLSTGSNSVTNNIQINNPTLWDEYEGNLYTLKTYVKVGGAIWHSLETKYGYRYFKFDKDTGFWLNGKNLKLRGVCMHHDLGCLGAEVNRSAIERQINLLIDMGVNAIRIAHNPGSSEFLNVCAEKGILVIEELFDCWTTAKKTYDFARYYNAYAKEVVDNTINRGKNNPAIIMWSIGNEIIRTSDSYDSATATGFVQNMINWIKAIDNERMVTMGDDTPTNSISQNCMKLLDVIGVNYGSTSEYSSLRTAISNKPIYSSETTSALSSRGVYARDNANKQCSSFDDDKANWGEYASIELKKHMTDINYLVGMFVWTGFDYIGEPTPFNAYPSKSTYFGIYDTCGFPKDIMYMYQSRWTSNPMIHILPHWDWESGDIKVWLYSNCYKVELFLNGTSLGEKLQTDIGSKYQFEYSVAYTKGTLVANGYNQNGDIVAQNIIYTSQGTASTTKLSADKTSVNINSDDLVFVTCDIVDKNGVIVPIADDKITFTVEGGTIVGTDNGNATCVEKYRSNVKTAFNGKVLCVVKHNGVSGNMTIKANGANLAEQTIIITKGEKTVLSENAKQPFIDATNPTIYDYTPAVKYTITNNLTNCTTSNSSAIINENSSYTATITANSGYTLSDVNVTMGGADISSTAVSDGVITINSVTGNIVITATATTVTSPNLVFQVNSASMNTADNTLTDNIAGISATLTGNPTVSGNEIAFTASDRFNFDIRSLNLTNGNRTVRVKFTPTTLDNNLRNVLTLGEATNNWNGATTVYINNSKLIM